MENDTSRVIDRTALIENLLDQIIIKYISPREEIFPFINDVLLDNSIMPIAAKLKVVIFITQVLNLRNFKPQPFYEVFALRNAFAHHSLFSHPTLEIHQNPEDDKPYYQLKIMRSEKIERMSREKALEKFNREFDSAKESLSIILSSMTNLDE